MSRSIERLYSSVCGARAHIRGAPPPRHMGHRYSKYCCRDYQTEEEDDLGAKDYLSRASQKPDYENAQNSARSSMDGADPGQLHTLQYLPISFEAQSTIDHDRSHSRYAKVVLHTSRSQRTNFRSKVWEDWIIAAVAGKKVVYLDMEGKLTPASYTLDPSLSVLTIRTSRDIIPIMVDRIQLICPAADFMVFFGNDVLTNEEKDRAVFVQYITTVSERHRVCFLEESTAAKTKFVQALTALWLEKRNEDAMWF